MFSNKKKTRHRDSVVGTVTRLRVRICGGRIPNVVIDFSLLNDFENGSGDPTVSLSM